MLSALGGGAVCVSAESSLEPLSVSWRAEQSGGEGRLLLA